MSIINDIYKITEGIETPLERSELASLVLYSILQSDYYEGKNQHINLGKNYFDEYVVYHEALSNVGINRDTEKTVVNFEPDDKTFYINESKEGYPKKLLNNYQYNCLKKLDIIFNKERSLVEGVEELRKNPLSPLEYETALMVIRERRNLNDKDLVSFLHENNPLQLDLESYTDLKAQYKTNNYRKPSSQHITLLLEPLTGRRSIEDSQEIFERFPFTRSLSKTSLKYAERNNDLNIKDIREAVRSDKKNIIGDALDKIIGKQTLVSKKEAAVLDIIEHHNKDNFLERFKTFSSELLERPIAETILSNYKVEIDRVLTEVYKLYPELLKNKDSEARVEFFEFKDAPQTERYDIAAYAYAKSMNKLNIYSDYTRTHSSIVNGLRSLSSEFDYSNGIMGIVKNDIEVLAVVIADRRETTRNSTTYNTMEVPSIVLDRIDEDIRGVSREHIKNLLEHFFKMAQKENVLLVHDLCIVRRGESEVLNNKVYGVIKELEREYPDVILLNEGALDYKATIKTDALKWTFVEHCYTKEIKNDIMKDMYKKLIEYTRTQEYSDLNISNYQHDNEEKFLNIINNIENQTNKQIKVRKLKV